VATLLAIRPTRRSKGRCAIKPRSAPELPRWARLADVIKPVLDHYGRSANDPLIRTDILVDMRHAVVSGEIEAIRSFLSKDEARWIGNLQWAYFQRFEGLGPLDGYENWARAKCDLLLAVAGGTREDDGIIQHLLNYEDFHVEVLPFPFGPTFIVRLYEMRGVDFFLFHYMGGETSAHEDGALFDHAASVTKSLTKLGRTAEATLVERELVARKERLTAIRKDFQGPEYDPSANLIARIRIAGERFWSDYLTPEVWVRVDRQSASELVDAFSTEYLLRQHVLSTWSTVALALCKVVEREIARAIFVPWKRHFHAATWVPPRAESEKSRKRLESRAMTFKTLQSCSGEKGHSPTLGQLLFIAKFWNDPLMEQCTEVFRSIRAQASRVRPTFSDDIVRLVRLLEQPFTMNESVVNIPDARNRSAHPREDDEIDWNVFIGHIKDTLGKPPAELLKLLVSLTAASNAAQQGAPGDAPQAARP
jgi:hypothetical protein